MDRVYLSTSSQEYGMVQDDLECLEGRVKKIIEVVKQLKEERAQLLGQVRELDHKLSRREKEFLELDDERRKVRSKVERLLGELSLIK
ncbi:MAG TPA: cell division protein ZapB [Nitrospiria bacterium]